VLLAVAAMAVPLLWYLLLSQRGLFAAVGFIVVLPLLVLGRPGLTATLLTPIIAVVLLTDEFPHAAQPMVGGALAALLMGIFAHVTTGTARLRREHFAIIPFAAVLGASLLLPAVHRPTASPAYDLIGLLEGPILLAAALAAPPSLHRVAQVVARN
jgi:ABC-type Mn2+/Zn2+ transport system permease subunit